MNKPRLNSLLRFQELYEQGKSGGPWLGESLGRALLGNTLASASLEFVMGPGGGSKVAEGPLAGRSVGELIADYGEDLIGRKGLELMENGLGLEIKFAAADFSDLPLRVPEKLEAVIILEARPGAVLYYGRRRDLKEETFRTLLLKSPGPEVLQDHPADSGQVFLAPAGFPFVLGRGVMAYVVSVKAPGRKKPRFGADKKTKSSWARSGPMTAAIPPSRFFIKGLGFVEGKNAVTWLYASEPVCTARLDLREEWNDLGEADGPRPGITALTGVFGRALLTAGDETETLERGATVMISAHCRQFRINPATEGAVVLKTWFADREREILQPLMRRGLSRRELEGLYGFFGGAETAERLE